MPNITTKNAITYTNLNTLCYFFFQPSKNHCQANPHVIDVLMDPNNDTIHVIYTFFYPQIPTKLLNTKQPL